MKGALASAAVAAAVTAGCASAPAPDLAALKQQVWRTEEAFARSMAERDHAAFSALLSEDAVFIGPRVLHGKAEVAAAWKAYFEGPQPPFSWKPDQVEVLADGTLAHSSGPVRDAEGRLILRFNSVWRQEAPGVWRIVFDKGQPLTAAEREAEYAGGAGGAGAVTR